MIHRLIRIWRVQWWRWFFLFFLRSIHVWENCFEKSKLFPQSEIWNQDLFKYVELDIPFMGIIHKLMIQKFKIVSLSWNLVLRLIKICRIRWWYSILLLSTGNIIFWGKFGIQYWCSILPFSNGNVLFRQF